MESNLYQMSLKQNRMKQHCTNVSQVQRGNYFESRVTYTIIYQLTLRNNLRHFRHARIQFATYTLYLEGKNPGDICQ